MGIDAEDDGEEEKKEAEENDQPDDDSVEPMCVSHDVVVKYTRRPDEIP